jgi:ADP-ribosylation factor protein 6
MGQSLSKMLDKIFGSKEMRLLMLGLDAAGKTSTYNLLQVQDTVKLETTPPLTL